MYYQWLVAICWSVFIVYWGVTALSAKRTIGRNYGSLFWMRIAMIVVVVAIVGYLNASGIRIGSVYHASDLIGWIGVLITAAGIAFAIWARMHLASNWGMPMSVKEDPELVTTGPYAYVRHPIYSGIILAMIGSAIVSGPFWAVILVFSCIYFVYSAIQEEGLMLSGFPDQYPAYKARTKMLIPYVF